MPWPVIIGSAEPPMEAELHVPVMLDDVLAAVAPLEGATVVDATFGNGGYSRAFVAAGARVVAIDRDPDAVSAGAELAWATEGLTLVEARFSGLDDVVRSQGHEFVDAVVADVGVSSMQIDQPERGFSFLRDGPLDMRMEQAGESAADIVNGWPQSALTRLIGLLGEDRQAPRIAATIVRARPFATTLQLADAIEAAVGRRPGDRIHPATRTFQALRIQVNRELDELADALLAAEAVLRPGGRLAVVSFHSLEDRLVKRFLQARGPARGGSRHAPVAEAPEATFETPRRGAVTVSEAEAARNPRARSARLRVGVRTAAEPSPFDRAVLGVTHVDPAAGPRKAGRR